MLEAAMGWWGYHLHCFDVGGRRYGVADPDWDLNFLDEGKYRLGKVLPVVGSKMRWDYDFGDGWEHDVLVEAIDPPESGVAYPLCLTGRRACPPEDCGGPWGYADMVEILADLDHPEYEERMEWVPLDFDPAHFDADEITARMRSLRPLEGW